MHDELVLFPRLCKNMRGPSSFAWVVCFLNPKALVSEPPSCIKKCCYFLHKYLHPSSHFRFVLHHSVHWHLHQGGHAYHFLWRPSSRGFTLTIPPRDIKSPIPNLFPRDYAPVEYFIIRPESDNFVRFFKDFLEHSLMLLQCNSCRCWQ